MIYSFMVELLSLGLKISWYLEMLDLMIALNGRYYGNFGW